MRYRPLAALAVAPALLGAGLGCVAEPRPERDEPPAAVAAATELGWRGDAAIVLAIEQASARAGVPRDVLLALGWAETRLQSRVLERAPAAGEVDGDAAPAEGEGARCGVFGLDEGSARAQAARLLGVDPDALCADAGTEAHAAAARLRELAGGDAAPPRGDREAWFAALDRWHPALAARGYPYGEHVLRVARRGFRALDALGHVMFLPPDSALGARLAASVLDRTDAEVGVVRAAATPDTPLATWRGPACDYRASSRGPGDVSYVIIHTCEGGFAGCLSTVTSCGGSQVSSHYVVSYGGERVQAVEEHDTAWHVGCLNGSSIGIEHEGFAGAADHPDEQYCASAELVRSICDRWGIPCDRSHVIGHVEANERFCHGDHWDPGPNWDWDRFMRYVRDGCRCAPSPEVCDGVDNDCNGVVDEGVLNACGTCGETPAEVCNGADDDCDGTIDEGVCTHARVEPGALPDALDLGTWWSFTVTFTNDGTTPWPAGELAVAFEGDGLEGEGAPTEAREVGAGESIEVRLRARATREGAVSATVSAVVEGERVEVGWRWDTTARRPLLGARFVDASVPLELRVGEVGQGWAAVVNDGRAPWPRGTVIASRETSGVVITSGPLDEVAPGDTVRVALSVEAEARAIGQTLERTLVVRDPEGEVAAWSDAERIVRVLVRARDGSLAREGGPGAGDDMLGGGCSTTGDGAGAGAGVLLVLAAMLWRTRRRRPTA